MAKSKKNRSDTNLPTLNKTVPHVVGFIVLAILFIAAIRIVRTALGLY
ncbi:MAG: hypothetical protein AAB874_00485 [Patescibacteria group bacterium]